MTPQSLRDPQAESAAVDPTVESALQDAARMAEEGGTS